MSDYYIGCDPGKKHDPSAIMAVQKKGDQIHLVHKKKFPLGTQYSEVLGYLKMLNEKFKEVHMIYIDQTGVGEVFVEEAVNSGLKNVRGVMLTLPEKKEIMVYIKEVMEAGRLHVPFDRELINEMNVERYEIMKSGQVQYSHPSNTHDDLLWALALAVYASRRTMPTYHPVYMPLRIIKPVIDYARAVPQRRLHNWGSIPDDQTGKLCLGCGWKRAVSEPECPNCGRKS